MPKLSVSVPDPKWDRAVGLAEQTGGIESPSKLVQEALDHYISYMEELVHRKHILGLA